MEKIEDIIDRCKKNDSKAQEFLFNTYSKILLGICCRYIKDRNDAEDVLQDSFIKIFLNINQFRAVEGILEGGGLVLFVPWLADLFPVWTGYDKIKREITNFANFFRLPVEEHQKTLAEDFDRFEAFKY